MIGAPEAARHTRQDQRADDADAITDPDLQMGQSQAVESADHTRVVHQEVGQDNEIRVPGFDGPGRGTARGVAGGDPGVRQQGADQVGQRTLPVNAYP